MSESMPLVFSKVLKHHLPEEWYKHIKNNIRDYESLRIISVTRVKDLESPWAHEYVQFIVEDEVTQNRARIYAERGVSKSSIHTIAIAATGPSGFNPITFGRDSVDGVTIGFNEDGDCGRWGGKKDLPLPLEAFLYTDEKPKFVSLAETIALVSKKGGTYNLLGNNCYWFAYTTMKDHGTKNNGAPKKVYAKIGGGTGRVRDLYSYHITRRYKEYYRVGSHSHRSSIYLLLRGFLYRKLLKSSGTRDNRDF